MECTVDDDSDDEEDDEERKVNKDGVEEMAPYALISKSKGKEAVTRMILLQDDGKKGKLQKNLHLAGHTAAATRQQQLAKSPNELDESTPGSRLIYRKTSTVMKF
jgi:hypothetical protein